MNGILRDFRHAVCMSLLLPALIFSASFQITEGFGNQMPSFDAADAETANSSEDEIHILLHDESGNVHSESLESYIVGAVMGEMPASFEIEALKAQAVAARTYALKNQQTGGKHGDGGVCTSPECCQAYCKEETFLLRGGSKEEVNKIKKAVEDTAGLVLCYDQALIEATYFSCSGGMTEDAAEVWGVEYPYLVATDSPGEEYARYYYDSKQISFRNLCEALQIQPEDVPDNWIGAVTYTAGGGVSTIELLGSVFTGVELRRILGLRSTLFDAEVTDDGICFHTKGYGHRVGMSQYGANAMALEGYTFAEILAHYYPGTELENYVESGA